MTEPAHFSRNRFLQIVTALYAAFWCLLAIDPVYRSDWLLENLLVFAAVLVLGLTYRWFRFTNLAYLLLAIFLALHAIGAHYTYAEVPAGFWLRDALGLTRNHFDRLIHFGFGLLLLYPMAELLAREGGAGWRWSVWLGTAAVVALSSLFEVIEAVIAQVVAPDLGMAYLGTQGDMWDAQKDMAAALLGAFLGAVALLLQRRAGREDNGSARTPAG